MMKLHVFILVALLIASGVRCEFDEYSDDVYSDGESQPKEADTYNDYRQIAETPSLAEDNADTSDPHHLPPPKPAPAKKAPVAQKKVKQPAKKAPEKKAPQAAKKPEQKPVHKAPAKKTTKAETKPKKKPVKKPSKKTPAKKAPKAAKKFKKTPVKKPAKKAPVKKTSKAAKPEKKSGKKPTKKSKKIAPKAAKQVAPKKATKQLPLMHCSDLGLMSLQVLMALFTILASAILGLNAIVLWSAYMNESEDKFKFNIMKTTLAIIDICNGVYIFAVIVPNLFWTINNATRKLSVYKLTAPTSSNTEALGTIFMLIFITYLYCLTYFGVLRYNSVKYPLQVAETPKSQIRLTIALLVIVSVIVSTIPAWFPSTFTFDYQHNIFTFWVESIGKSTLQNSISLVLLLLIFIPYLSLLGTTIASWIVTKQNAEECLDDVLTHEREIAMTKTVSAMVISFIVTTFPFLLVSFLLVSEVVSFEAIHVAHTATFFVFCCRSVINMAVYLTSAIPETGAMRETLSPGSSKRSSVDEAPEVCSD